MIQEFKKLLNKTSTIPMHTRNKERVGPIYQNNENVNIGEGRIEEEKELITSIRINSKYRSSCDSQCEIIEQGADEQSQLSQNGQTSPRFLKNSSEIFNKSNYSESISIRREQYQRIIHELKNQRDLSWQVHRHQIDTLEQTIYAIEADYQLLFNQLNHDHAQQIQIIKQQNSTKLFSLLQQQQISVRNLKTTSINTNQVSIPSINRDQNVEAMRKDHQREMQAIKSLHNILMERIEQSHKQEQKNLKKQLEQSFVRNQRNKQEWSDQVKILKQQHHKEVTKLQQSSQQNQQAQAQVQRNAELQKTVEKLRLQNQGLTKAYEVKLDKNTTQQRTAMKKLEQEHNRAIQVLIQKHQSIQQKLIIQIKENQHYKVKVKELQTKIDSLKKNQPKPQVLLQSGKNNLSHLLQKMSRQEISLIESQTHKSYIQHQQHLQEQTQFVDSRLLERKEGKIQELQNEIEGLRLQLDIQDLQKRDMEDLTESQIKKLIDYDISHERMIMEIKSLRVQKDQLQEILAKRNKNDKQRRNSVGVQLSTPQYTKNTLFETVESSKNLQDRPSPRYSDFQPQEKGHFRSSSYQKDPGMNKPYYDSTQIMSNFVDLKNLKKSQIYNIFQKPDRGSIQKFLLKIRALERQNQNYLQQMQTLENTNSILRRKVLRNLQSFDKEKKLHNEISDLRVQLRRSEHRNKTLSMQDMRLLSNNDNKSINSFKEMREICDYTTSKKVPYNNCLQVERAQSLSTSKKKSNKLDFQIGTQEEQQRMRSSCIEKPASKRIKTDDSHYFRQESEQQQNGTKQERTFNLENFMKRLKVNRMVKSNIIEP